MIRHFCAIPSIMRKLYFVSPSTSIPYDYLGDRNEITSFTIIVKHKYGFPNEEFDLKIKFLALEWADMYNYG